MKKLTLLTLFCALATGAMAGDGWNEGMNIFKGNANKGETGYRIPAITATSQGTLVAVSDIRYDNRDMPGRCEFIIKTSDDGGSTWNEESIIAPKGGITDPSIVHDPTTGKTFLFGYQNTSGIVGKDGKFSFMVYTSEDGGKTWDDGNTLATNKNGQNEGLIPDNYKYMLQGPGNGMVYNGTIYMPIQTWHNTDKPLQGVDHKNDGTSGYIYSEDGGKTWKLSGLLRPEGVDVTSESSVFHHNGKIYLAAKAEVGHADAESGKNKRRVVYCTSDNGQTWEKVEEDFIPKDAAMCETSTLALNDQVYVVGYAIQDQELGGYNREDMYITTNTGRKVKVFEGKTLGYTSLAQDQDNLYVLYEGNKANSDIDMRRFDIASKEYTNLNAQILDRGQSLLDVQGKLSSDQYVGGTYTNKSESGAEAVVELNNFKIGAFHRNTKDNSDDVYRTIPYNLKETTLVLSQDNAFMQGDNIFAGYQAGKIEYSNKSTNDLTSFVMGYTFNKELENDKTYTFALNGVYSNNKVERNKAEGVGRTAEFDSYSISMKNALSKNISFTDSSKLKLTAGLNTTVFGHDGFEEDGGLPEIDGKKFNNATVDKSQNVSNEIFAKATLDQRVKLTDKSSVRLALDLGWEKELMDVDEWRDEFTVLDVEKEFATPVKKHEGGLGKAEVSATFDLAEKVELGVGYSMDTDGESTATGKVTYKL